jgi:hypothetical protein
LIRVTIRERNAVEKMNDFKKTGIGNLKIIYEVVPYRTVEIINGTFLSFLSFIVYELIIPRWTKKGKREIGSKTLFTNIIRNINFIILNGRYPNKVGAAKMITIPYRGINKG